MRSRLALLFSLSALFIITGCAPTAAPKSDLDTPEYHYRLGVRSLEEGDYATAHKGFQRAIDLDPKFALGHSGVGLVKAYSGHFDGGKIDVDKGVSLASKNPLTYVYRGRFWTVNRSARNWFDKAEKDFTKALSLNPGNEAAEYYYGEALFFATDFRRAEAQFGKVVAIAGELAGKADERWATVQKIVRARPGSDAARKIAIKSKISRADLAVLFTEELKLKAVFEKTAAPAAQAVFQAPGAAAQSAVPQTPTDVVGSWAEPWIKDALELGVFEADPSGMFYPEESVTRVDYAMAVQRILARATNDNALETKYFGEAQSRFTDVPSSHFAYNAMALCAERGIMKADMMTGQFNPGGNISGADALLIIREIQNSLRITF